MNALLLALSLAFAADVDAPSQITDVVVYADRARVTRTATVSIPAGRSDLVFDGLPLALVPASLTAAGEGTAGAAILGIDLRTERGVEDRDARLAALKTDKRDHEDAIRVQADTVTRVKADIAFLVALKPVAPGALQEGLLLAGDAADQLGALSRQIGTDLLALYAEQRTAERAIEEHRREIARIDREVAQLGGGTPDANRVAVGIEATRPGRVTVRLQYVVTGASWSPHWDARYRPDQGRVRLDLSGEVVQTTGETWDGVKLVLSTAQPSQGTAPPVLVPFVLQEGYGRTARAASADKVTAVEYAASAREDVPADGTRRRVFLTSMDFDAELIHHVVARRVQAAWLTARVTNTGEATLLGGPMSAYMGSAYVGEGQLPLVAPGAEADVSFGVDDRVKVERVRLEKVTADAKPLGNRERARYGWKTTVGNHTGKPITVHVHDQVPVSRDAAFEVETTTTPELRVPSDGLLEWTAELPNGESRDFVLEYEVSWPEGDRPVLME